MEFNRNHYFLAGLVVLLLGIQVRMVDSFVLSSESTRFLATRFPMLGGAALAQMSPEAALGAAQDVAPARMAGLGPDLGRVGASAAQPGDASPSRTTPGLMAAHLCVAAARAVRERDDV